jgi:hypothetical protein
MDSTVVVSGIFGLVGVGLGWKLNESTALKAAQRERDFAERQKVRDREEAAAALLDERLVEGMAELPQAQGPAIELAEKLGLFKLQLLQAWQRVIVLQDPEITRRINALDMALFIAIQHVSTMRVRRWDGEELVEPVLNPWPLQVAASEVRMALASFQRREQPNPALFPTSKELITLAHEGGRDLGLQPVHDLLVDRSVGAI